MKKLLKIFVLFILYSLFFTNLPQAHPMPIVIQEFDIIFEQKKVLLTYHLKIEPFTVDRFYPEIDKNNDKTIDEGEVNTFSDSVVLKHLTARLNNRDLQFTKTSFKSTAQKDIFSFEDDTEITYEAVNPDIRETNAFLIKYDKGFVPDDPYGDLVIFADNTFGNDAINQIATTQNTQDKLSEYTVDFEFKNSEGQQSEAKNHSTQPSQNRPNIFARFFNFTNDTSKKLTTQVFDNQRTGIAFFAVGLIFAFIAGSLHAVTPGHGKSMMAAFLIGKNKSKFSDVLVLGLSITLAHTIVIFALGFALLGLKKTEMFNQLLPYFEKVSAALLIILAITLLNKAYQNWKHLKYHKEFGNEHHGHTHGWEKKDVKINSKWDLFTAGLGGGIVPCVDALTLLVISVNVGKIGFGLILILSFSIGLAAAIVFVGLLLVAGKNKLNLEKRFGAVAEVYSPLITGVIIILLAMRYFIK